MKKHLSKIRLLCAVLAMVIVLASLPFAASAEPPEVIPIIRMSGGQSYLTNVETGERYISFYEADVQGRLGATQDELLDAVKRLDWKTIAGMFNKFLWDNFGELQMYPDGTSKNAIYRSETDLVPGFDPKAPENIIPVRPKPPEPVQAAAAALPAKTAALLAAPAEEEPPADDAVTESILERISAAFFGMYDGIQEYLDKNGYRATQPPPKPEWAETYAGAPNTPTYFFSFDWRMSPCDIADMLDRYIQAVKAKHNCSKVIIQPVSGSNAAALAYVDQYINKNEGDIDAAGVLFNVSMANGMAAYGSIFSKRILIDSRVLGSSTFLVPLVYGLDPQIHAVLNVLYITGLLDVVCALLEFMPRELVDILFDEGLIPLYGLFPGMWSLVPPDMYQDAKKASFGAKLTDPAYQPFFEKIDRYYEIQKNSSKVLQDAAKKTKIGVLCGYDNVSAVASVNQGIQGDTSVETVYASFGATCSLYGENLGKNYKQINTACGHNHVSADNLVDASTCALPENTWFVKGIIHGGNFVFNGFVDWWYNEENPTVHTSDRWPQYLTVYGQFGEGWQEAVYPLQKPIYEGGELFANLSVFWHSFLTLWNRMLHMLTGTMADLWYAAKGWFA